MHPQEFIRRHLLSQLTAEGYSATEAQRLTVFGLVHYQTCAIFPKGKVFDECLKAAKAAAKGLGIKKSKRAAP